VEHLTKYYGEIRGIEDISFKIGKGEIVGFLGPNGSARPPPCGSWSATCRPPAARRAWPGLMSRPTPWEVRKKIGYLPEHPPLYNDMTVRSYLGFVGRLRGLSKKEIKTGIERVAADLLARGCD